MSGEVAQAVDETILNQKDPVSVESFEEQLMPKNPGEIDPDAQSFEPLEPNESFTIEHADGLERTGTVEDCPAIAGLPLRQKQMLARAMERGQQKKAEQQKTEANKREDMVDSKSTHKAKSQEDLPEQNIRPKGLSKKTYTTPEAHVQEIAMRSQEYEGVNYHYQTTDSAESEPHPLKLSKKENNDSKKLPPNMAKHPKAITTKEQRPEAKKPFLKSSYTKRIEEQVNEAEQKPNRLPAKPDLIIKKVAQKKSEKIVEEPIQEEFSITTRVEISKLTATPGIDKYRQIDLPPVQPQIHKLNEEQYSIVPEDIEPMEPTAPLFEETALLADEIGLNEVLDEAWIEELESQLSATTDQSQERNVLEEPSMTETILTEISDTIDLPKNVIQPTKDLLEALPETVQNQITKILVETDPAQAESTSELIIKIAPVANRLHELAMAEEPDSSEIEQLKHEIMELYEELLVVLQIDVNEKSVQHFVESICLPSYHKEGQESEELVDELHERIFWKGKRRFSRLFATTKIIVGLRQGLEFEIAKLMVAASGFEPLTPGL